VVQTVEGLQIVRIDLGAVVAASVALLLAVQGVACVAAGMLLVVQVLVVRLLLLLLLFGAVFHGQRGRLWGLSVTARLEAIVAAMKGQAVVAVAVVAVAVVAAAAVGFRLDGHESVGQRRQQGWRTGGRGYRGRGRAGPAHFPFPLALRDVMTAKCSKYRNALIFVMFFFSGGCCWLWCFGCRVVGVLVGSSHYNCGVRVLVKCAF